MLHIQPGAKDTASKKKKKKPFQTHLHLPGAHKHPQSSSRSPFFPTIYIFPRLASHFEEKEKSKPPDLGWQLHLSDCKSEISLIHLAKLQKRAFFRYLQLAAPNNKKKKAPEETEEEIEEASRAEETKRKKKNEKKLAYATKFDCVFYLKRRTAVRSV